MANLSVAEAKGKIKTNTRIRLSKKFFDTLELGKFIMNNTFPVIYDEITKNNKEMLWKKWRGENGRMVTIFDNREDCLTEWWSLSGSLKSQTRDEYKTREIYRGRFSKKIFYEYPAGHYLLFTQDPFEIVELREDRDAWKEYSKYAGLMVMVFKNQVDALMAKVNCCPE